MALRFQSNDEVDRTVKEERRFGGLVFLLVLFAVIDGAFAWFSGESLASYTKNLAWLVGIGFVYWIASSFYYEFRIRTKEIDGKVSAIEETVNTSKEDHAELLERLTAIGDKLEELAAINASEVLRRENDEFRGHLKNVHYQLECTRRLQQIEDDLRELRTNAVRARFAKEGEVGYIPKQSLGGDRWFTVSSDENAARSSTIFDFGYIEERLDKFTLSEYDGDLPALAYNLGNFQTTLREEARKSVGHSLNEIALSGRFLTDQLHEMLEQIAKRNKEYGRSQEIEEKRKENAQWASEKIQRGQLPLPD